MFERGGASDRLFFLERGTVDMLVPPHLTHLNTNASANDLAALAHAPARTVHAASTPRAASPPDARGAAAASLAAAHPSGWRRIQRISGGGIAGECGFFLQVAQPFTAVARAASAVWVVDRAAFDALARDQPHLCILVPQRTK